MDNRSELKNKIDAWFEENSDDMLSDLSKLISVKSIRGESEKGAPYGIESRRVLSEAESMLKKRGFDVTLFEDMIITAELGSNPPLVGILVHLDVVAEGDGWDSDPFKMEIKDGKLFGRGVMDNKGPAVAAMYTMYCIRELFPDLKHGFQVILGSGEETGFEDIEQYLTKNTMPPNVFSPDAEYPVVNIERGRFFPVFGAKWEKDETLPRIINIIGGNTPNTVPNCATAIVEGFSLQEVEPYCKDYSEKTGVKISSASNKDANEINKSILITAEGVSAHASLPERGNNAQTALLEMLANMPFAKSESFDYLCKLNKLFPHGDYRGTAFGIDMEDKHTGRITVNFGVLRFSELEFSGNFDSRTPGCADEINLFNKTKEIFKNEGIDVSYHEIKNCHHTPEQSAFVQSLLRVYEEYTGNKGECLAIGGLTYVHGIPGGVAFGCVMPGEDNKIHGANEFISIERLIQNAKMFTQVILDNCL